MDIVSHALWAAAAGEHLRRKGLMGRGAFGATIAIGAMPDVVSFIPALAWGVREPHPFAAMCASIVATPGGEPLPAAINTLSHNLHCVTHSVVIAALVTLVVWRARPAWIPVLVGWWLHIAMDIPTHSTDYYAVPIFYPLSDWGFNGVPWTTPWIMALNYAALAVVFIGLFVSGSEGHSRRAAGRR
jgi:LexA-binding, inner membrane-associated putative hydrolase